MNAPVTLKSLYLEIAAAGTAGKFYPDPPREDAARAERIEVLAAEGLIDATLEGWYALPVR